MGNSAFNSVALGENTRVSGETPGGTINGSNDAFTTANNYVAGSLKVYRDGIRLLEGSGNDFTEDGGNDFTMTTAPETGSILQVDYLYSGDSQGNASTLEGQSLAGLNNATSGYQDWTPTYTNLTVGNGTVVAKYAQRGKVVSGYFEFVLGSTSSVGDVRISPPVTPSSNYTTARHFVGDLVMNDNTGNQNIGRVRLETTTQLRMLPHIADGSYTRVTAMSSSVPFTWATSDLLSCNFEYEAD